MAAKKPRVCAIVLAAGSSTRFGASVRKQFINLADKPLVVWCLETLNKSEKIDEIILVVNQDAISYCQENEFFKLDKIQQIVAGGKERQDSVMAGLKSIYTTPDYVLIHDGVRPFITEEMIDKTLEAAALYGASAVATKVTDTVKEANNELFVERTIPREKLWCVQTPQTFQYPLLIAAYHWAFDMKLSVTDDTTIVEQFGKPVKLVPSSHLNIKITTPDDLILAEAILKLKGKCA